MFPLKLDCAKCFSLGSYQYCQITQSQQPSYGEWRCLVRAETIVNNDNNDINVSLTSFVSGENVILIS